VGQAAQGVKEVRVTPMAAPKYRYKCQESLLAGEGAADGAWISHAPAWLSTMLVAIGITAAGLGCATEATEADVLVRGETGRVDPTIFGGALDDDDAAVPGVVALRVGTGGTFELCSGALVAPNLVLTARHCVTKNTTTAVSCDEEGRSANGIHVTADEDPKTIGVYLGASPSFAKAPVAIAHAIVAPETPYLCDSDIALVVLDRPVTEVAPIPVRIHSPARAGETIRSVGYGQNDKRVPIGTRFRRGNVPVLAQGKMVSPSKTPLGPHEFEVGKSICQGDSGGPALSEETGAVIGVVSRGSGCDDDFGHIYTTTAGFEAMFERGFALAGSEPNLEPGDVATAQSKSHAWSAPGPAAPPDAAEQGGCSAAPTPARTDGGRRGPAPAGVGIGVLLGIVALRVRRRGAR